MIKTDLFLLSKFSSASSSFRALAIYLSIDKRNHCLTPRLSNKCTDGPLTLQIGKSLMPNGRIHGTDSSNAMIQAAKGNLEKDTTLNGSITFEVLDANHLTSKPELQNSSFDKVFSNAAMHWILASSTNHSEFFRGVNNALKPGGKFIFEMGGMGNVAEMRTAFVSTIAKRIGLENARKADPWFFPDVAWMKRILEETGFVVEKIELEYRPTPMETGSGGGLEGWTRLFGKQFFDAIADAEDREKCIMEAVDLLKGACTTPEGKELIGYVRLRALASKV